VAIADPIASPAASNGKAAKALTEFPYRFEVVQLGDTFVDALYQRQLTSLAEEIGENFNPALVGTLILSERTGEKTAPKGKGDEPYATVDGQTRREGALRAGVTELPALVYIGLTRQDEASLFSLLQRKRRNMMTHERFKASLVAKEPEAMGIAKALRKYGYEVGPRGGAGSKTVQAVAALEAVYRRDPKLLERVIYIIDAAWGGPDADTREAFSAEMIRGVGRTLGGSDLDENRLIDRMSKVTPLKLRMNADHLREGKGGGGHTSMYMADALLGVYSKRS
jgi:hypothetical protein